ncbi:MAG: hypothetical protein KDD73_06595 [Anaerolineales bacterium]|nr:hypothetical protein [Anaerolineales bacterium]MCB9126864.1 hypothetical protein [Ardenticatenales bacterium]MCB9172844.1 hypothetical protein [Ardenticatenales bacterium]
MSKPTVLTQRFIFWFWLPLATMWIIMSAEQPLLAAVVSRLPEATQNLAAWGLTFSFSLIIESPVIMLLTAGTALAIHRQAYHRLMQFTTVLAVVMTAIHLLLAITPAYSYILREWVGAPAEIIPISNHAFLIMLPWTGMIAYRRLWEGVMIRFGFPRRVTIVIVIRMVATALVLFAGLWLGRWNGASVGAAALGFGVTMGALSAWWLARPTLREHLSTDKAGDAPLGWAELVKFYTPLAMTSAVTLIGQPILAFGLARAPLPLRSLAIWPVIMALVFIGRSVAIAFQEVVVALLDDPQSYRALKRFGFSLSVGASGLFLLLAITPAARLWFEGAQGLSAELASMAILPTILLFPVPALNALLSWFRGVLVHNKHTSPISIAVILNMMVLLMTIFVGPMLIALPGAVWAAIALTASLAAEALYLQISSRAEALQIERVSHAFAE